MADKLSATPRSGLLGFLADAAKASYSPQRTQQMQGLMQFLGAPDVAATLDRLSYGEPLTTGSGWTTQMRPETVGALMSAAGAMPSLKGVEAGAATVGRAIAPTVEKWGMRQVEAGTPIGRGLVDLTRGSRSYIDTYHGSPYKFDKFDSSKIGSGEGAQAYGHGLYLAEAPDVARGYATNLSNRDIANQGRLNAHANAKRLADLTGDAKYAADHIRSMLESNPYHEQKKLLNETIDLLESGGYAKPLDNQGNFYKVDLPDDQIAKMLDYDSPLKDQTPEIQALAKQYGLTSPDDLGGDLVVAMDAKRRAGADMMRQGGVPGIRYKDAQSRGGDQATTSNFVVFPGNEGLLRILERNDIPLE